MHISVAKQAYYNALAKELREALLRPSGTHRQASLVVP